jgi:hypothetical protein
VVRWNMSPNPILIYLIQIIFEFVHFLSINETFELLLDPSITELHFHHLFFNCCRAKKISFTHLKKSCWKTFANVCWALCYNQILLYTTTTSSSKRNKVSYIRNKLASGITLATAVEDLSFYTHPLGCKYDTFVLCDVSRKRKKKLFWGGGAKIR